MGGGKGGGGGCSDVGYGYSLTFGYAFCDKADEIQAFYMNGKKKWNGSITQSGDSFTCWTGNLGTVYASDYTENPVVCFMGDQTSAPASIQGLFTYNLSYKNLCWLYFDNAFIGDNVSSIPKYRVKAKRVNIFDNYTTYNDIEGTANPSYVILYILNKLLNINLSNINVTSFENAAQTLYNESMGISFVLSRSNKATKWIKEILRHIDGMLYYDVMTAQYNLKLLRADYDINNIPAIDENYATNVKITKGTWKNVITTFTFEYTNTDSGKTASITVTNTATKEVLGYDRPKKYKYLMASTQIALSQIIQRVVKKDGFPLASIKLRISIFDFPNIFPGDVFSFEYPDKYIEKNIYRIVKVSGDASNTGYYEVEAVEDIFANQLGLDTTLVPNTSIELNYNITSIPTNYMSYEIENIFTTESYYFMLLGKPDTTEVITQEFILDTESNKKYIKQIVSYGKTSTEIPANYSYSPTFILYFSDLSGNIPNINFSDADFQQGGGLLHINGKIFTYKAMERQPDNSIKITYLMALSPIQNSIPVSSDMYITTNTNIINNAINFDQETKTLNLSFKNLFTIGDSVTTTINRTNISKTPLAISNLQYYDGGSSNILKFIPGVRTRGASYINCDNIVAGEDENTFEGNFIINKNGSTVATITTPQFNNGYIEYDTGDYSNATWEIICSLNGIHSPSETINT